MWKAQNPEKLSFKTTLNNLQESLGPLKQKSKDIKALYFSTAL